MCNWNFTHSPLIITLFVLLIVWSVIWKGLALWRAAKQNDLCWYIVLFILNTAGILEILYLYVFTKEKNK